MRMELDSDDDSVESDCDDEVEEQVDGSITLDGLIEKFKQDGFLLRDSEYEIRDSRQVLIRNQSCQVCSITLPLETLFLTFVEIDGVEIDVDCYVHPLIGGEYGGRILTVSVDLNNYVSDIINLLGFDIPVLLVVRKEGEELIMKRSHRLKAYLDETSESIIKVLPDIKI